MSGVKGRSGGRNRLPTAVKLARGTLRPHRENRDEPRIDPKLPPMPEGLDADERASWEKFAGYLVDMGVLTVDNESALRDLACADVRLVRARLDLKKHGGVWTDPLTKKPYKSPRAAIFSEAFAELNRLRQAFGLEPQSRNGVKSIAKKAPEKTERDRMRELFMGDAAAQ